jgi:hypothetical protein
MMQRPRGTLANIASYLTNLNMENVMGRGILLWLLGVPIPIIIILLLIFHH